MRGLPAVALGAALLAAGVAVAYVPGAEIIANEVAKVNRAAGRAVPLALTVDLRMGDVDAVLASGTLVSDPRGASRLELTSPRGTWERHLHRDGTVRATRSGEPIQRPRPFLPPFYLLQMATGGELRGGLAELGGRPGAVGLGYVGAADCYVLGGRGPGLASDRPSLWIDQETLQPVRLDVGEGISFLLGPPKAFGALQVPEWIDVHAGDLRVARLEVRDARTKRLPPGSFDSAWLAGAPSAASPSTP